MEKIGTVGIVGAGKLGTALGRLVAKAGYELLIYSRPNPMHKLVLPTVLPTAELVSFEDLAQRCDVVILAVPHPVTAELDLAQVSGIIVDATNPWEATSTNVDVHSPIEMYPHLPVVRALNHVGYEELIADSFPAAGPKRAMAVYSQNEDARNVVAQLIESFGFEPVDIPAGAQSLFDADGRLFGAWLSADELRHEIERRD